VTLAERWIPDPASAGALAAAAALKAIHSAVQATAVLTEMEIAYRMVAQMLLTKKN